MSAEPLLQIELRDTAGRPARLADHLDRALVVVFVRHFG
jgi:hypothetical protein